MTHNNTTKISKINSNNAKGDTLKIAYNNFINEKQTLNNFKNMRSNSANYKSRASKIGSVCDLKQSTKQSNKSKRKNWS